MISQGLVYMPSLTDALRSLMDPKNKNHKVYCALAFGTRFALFPLHPPTLSSLYSIKTPSAPELCVSCPLTLPNTLRDT